MIDNAFIESASNILGDTANGLRGNEICTHFSKYAMKFKVSIPYPHYPDKNFPTKRIALRENLKSFTPEQQYNIIKDLCNLPKFDQNNDVKNLLVNLISTYSEYSNGVNELDEIITKTKEWLDDYPQTKKHYESALLKKSNQVFTRNLLDDLRCALESLVQNILNNEKSLEKQKNDLGVFFNSKQISQYISNFYIDKVIKFFTDYQNNHVKHQDSYKEKEIDFIFEQTTVLMRFLIQLHQE